MRRLESRDLDGARNAPHLHRFLVVKRPDLAAQHGRVLDGGIDHARDFRVHPEGGLAVRDIGKVIDRNVFPDVAVFRFFLKDELRFIGHRELGGHGR